MKATIKTWGNSLALRLPRQLTEELALSDGSAVEISMEGGEIRVRALKKQLTLDDLLATVPPLEKSASSREVGWGKPTGKETW